VQFATPFFLDVLAGIDDALRETRYELIVTAGREGADEVESLRRMVEGRRVDGVIFGRTRSRDPRIAYLLDAKFPFVALGRSQQTRHFAWLDIDHETSGRLALERLAARGHRRIALINTPEHLNYSRVCAEGFARATRVALERQRVVAAGLSEADGFAAMTTLLRQAKRPSAVVCGNDMLAFGAMRAIRAAGLRPGRDIALIGCDDHPLAASSDPPLTTFAAPIRAAGARVARMLLELMEGAPAAKLQELWQPSLVERESDSSPARAQEVA
jgi:LacI family transcriptional regulator